MKKIYLCIAILFISGMSYGQYFINHNSFRSIQQNKWPKHQQSTRNISKIQSLSNKKQLDSLVVDMYIGNTTMRYAKEYFIYDAQGNVTFNYSNDYDMNIELRKKYTYDANNRIIEYELSIWDSINNQWYGQIKKTTSYAATYYTTETNTWDPNMNQWKKTDKIMWYFNQNALDTLALSYSWNNQWELSSRGHISYDSNNNIILVINEEIIGGTWINANKTEYTYDANDNLIKELNYQWDTQNNSYFFDMKTSNGYDNQNRKIYSVMGGYNPNTSSWDYWDSTFQYYAPNSDIDSTMDFTNSPSNTWQPDLKNKMEYNNNYTLSDLILPTTLFSEDDIAYFNHMLMKINGFEYDNGQWPKSFEYNVYYSDFVGTGIKTTQKKWVRIAPNPAHDYLFIQMENKQAMDVRIYDVSGRMVKTQAINISTKINIQELKSGIYFIQITDKEHNIQTRKLIKE